MGLEDARVKHRGWREFWELRTAANKALNTLIVSTDLAATAVQNLPSALEDMRFDQVYGDSFTDAHRITSKVKNTGSEFIGAQHTLAAIAIPYAVAVYNEYVVEVVTLLYYNGANTLRDPASKMLGTLEQHLAAKGITPAGEQQRLFAALKEVRNVLIHRAGRVDQRLLDALAALTTADESAWLKATKLPFPKAARGDRLQLSPGHAQGTFWVAGNLATELNLELQTKLQRDLWLDLVVADFRQTHPAWWPVADDKGRSRLRYFANKFYGQLASQDAELEAALARAPVATEIPLRWPRP
jgi:hypothetical protein